MIDKNNRMKNNVILLALISVLSGFCACASEVQSNVNQTAPENRFIEKAGFHPADYTVLSIDSEEIPYEVARHSFYNDRGPGSTRPVIYHHNEDGSFLFVYETAEGQEIVEKITLLQGLDEQPLIERYEDGSCMDSQP